MMGPGLFTSCQANNYGYRAARRKKTPNDDGLLFALAIILNTLIFSSLTGPPANNVQVTLTDSQQCREKDVNLLMNGRDNYRAVIYKYFWLLLLSRGVRLSGGAGNPETSIFTESVLTVAALTVAGEWVRLVC